LQLFLRAVPLRHSQGDVSVGKYPEAPGKDLESLVYRAAGAHPHVRPEAGGGRGHAGERGKPDVECPRAVTDYLVRVNVPARVGVGGGRAVRVGDYDRYRCRGGRRAVSLSERDGNRDYLVGVVEVNRLVGHTLNMPLYSLLREVDTRLLSLITRLQQR